MGNSYSPVELNSRPNILEVVGRYTSLRRIGREELGICPLHDDKHPSLRVNPDKQVWFCDPCGVGGDVIKFVELVEGCSFKEAIQILGMADSPQPPRDTPERRAAEKVVAWVKDQSARMKARLRELDEQIALADEIPDVELAESLWRERQILADLAEDITRVEYLEDFLELKDSIEKITETRRGCAR